MDLRIVYGGIYFILQMIVALAENHKDCRMCKPGYYASRLCSDIFDTVCKPCSIGTYSHVHNVFKKCSPCSECKADEFVITACTKRRDTVCESCSTVRRHASEHFRKTCPQNDDPGVYGHVDDTSDDVLISDKGSILTGTDPSSVNERKENEMISDGSGESPTEESDVRDKNVYKLVNDTATLEEDESSGVSPIIDISDHFTNVTKVILPDGDGGDAPTVNATKANETVETGIIVVGPGIKLNNDTKVFVSGKVVEDTSVELEDELEDENIGDTNGNDAHVAHTGASKGSQEKSKGASIGVVVTVGLAAALVFFVLGFLVSRYWSGRRERTFNVIEAERRNGKMHVECSGIEYKDTDNNVRGKHSVYDEIPADTKQKNRNGTEAAAPPKEAKADPVYSKPIKRNSIPPKTAEKEEKDDVDEEWAGFSITRNSSSGSVILLPETTARPASEIQYIDEEADDKDETHKLIPQPSTSKADTSPDSAASSDGNGEPESATENTPMIPNDSENKKS